MNKITLTGALILILNLFSSYTQAYTGGPPAITSQSGMTYNVTFPSATISGYYYAPGYVYRSYWYASCDDTGKVLTGTLGGFGPGEDNGVPIPCGTDVKGYLLDKHSTAECNPDGACTLSVNSISKTANGNAEQGKYICFEHFVGDGVAPNDPRVNYSAWLTCAPVKAQPTCTASDLIIDHKDIAPGVYNGALAEGQVAVSCTGGDGTVELSFAQDPVDLNNGTTSELTFVATGGMTQKVSVSGGTTVNPTIRSTLHGTPPVGAFNGSTTLILTMQ